jgi:hypothetical protein
VKIMNANWVAGADGEDGRFELMIVTSDDRQHVVAPSPAAMTTFVAALPTRLAATSGCRSCSGPVPRT